MSWARRGVYEARGVRAVLAWHNAREQHAVQAATEVHCDDAQHSTQNEDEQLAAAAVGETYAEITGPALPPGRVHEARAAAIKCTLDWGVLYLMHDCIPR